MESNDSQIVDADKRFYRVFGFAIFLGVALAAAPMYLGMRKMDADYRAANAQERIAAAIERASPPLEIVVQTALQEGDWCYRGRTAQNVLVVGRCAPKTPGSAAGCSCQ